MARRSLTKTILLAGLVAGTLDILDAIIFYRLRSHVPAIRILQSVASGLLGRGAFTGGMPTAAIGLAIHFCIATFWAALFILIARSVPAMRRYAIASGMIYGLIVYAVMNYLVLPQTHARPLPTQASIVVLNGVCAIVFCIGLPIALINKRFA
jgi:uncharacterized membrane protein YagU involved in acid resistance